VEEYKMWILTRYLSAVLVLFLLGMGWTVSCEAESRHQVGDFVLRGRVSFGGRSVDIEQNELKYEEDYDLSRGVRLFDLFIEGEREDAGSLIDYFTIEGHNWGGDPYPWGYLRIGKHHLFELKLSRQEIDYRYNNLGFPLLASGDPHIFDWTRKITQVDFVLTPKDLPRFTFSYRRQWQNGEATITREILRDEFQLFYPLHKITNDYKFGIDYRLGPIDLSLEQEIRLFNDKITYLLPVPSSGGRFGSQAITSLDGYAWHQSETLTIPVTTLKAHSYLFDRLELNLGYIFSKSDLDYSFSSALSGQNFVGIGLNQTNSGQGDSDRIIHVADWGLTYRWSDNLFLHADYRFFSSKNDADLFEQEIRLFPDPLFIDFSPTIIRDWAKTDDDIRSHAVGFTLEYVPWENLSFRLGYRFQSRFASATLDREIHRKTTTRNKSLLTHIDYRPWKILSLSLEYENGSIDNPYTRISSTDEDRAKVKLRLRPWKNLNGGFSFFIKDRKNTGGASDYVEKSYSVDVWYQPVETFSFTLCYIRQDLEFNTEIVEASELGIGPIRAADFSEDNDIYLGKLLYNITPDLTAEVNLRFVDARGTYPLDTYDIGLRLGYRFQVCATNMSINLDYRHVALYEQRDDYGGSINDYAADLATVYIETEF